MPPIQNKKSPTRLMIAASESDANLFWATKFLVPDPMIFIEHRGKRYLVLSDLEVDRGKKEAEVDQVLSYSELEKKVSVKPGKRATMSQLIALVLKQLKVKGEIWVPANFPYLYAEGLRKLKFALTPKADPFYAERVIKTKWEKKAIEKTQNYISQAIQEAYRVLKESKIKGDKIYYHGELLTSELLKSVINLHLMKNNCIAKHTIVACGNQAVDPHCEGYGPIRPHQTLVMDVFPKSSDTQYYGDMTRTVVKGKASAAIQKLWHTVKDAQEGAIKKVRAGVDGQKIHLDIMSDFEAKGYRTGRIRGRMQGFFHGTGHGVGVDIHEPPRISKFSDILQEGTVVTVEPGLYYHGLGGVRIEDIVYVKKTGCEVLANCPKILEIK